MGSNMAECHPVAFRWPLKAKTEHGAVLMHVDPRFTRTSALCDIHTPIRAGTDILFLGAIINHVINSKRWNTDPFFREYVVNFTNAATLVNPDFKDTEDLDGLFSGLSSDGKSYSNASWAYQRNPAPKPAVAEARTFTDLLLQRVPGRPRTDSTLKDPQTVFQIIRRHYSRYTPEMVERVCGCPREKFLKVAETLLANSGRDRTSNITYAVGWTQHTVGVQIIRTAAMLQALLGNIGRPGGGVLALRGHATIQGSTDIATLYHSLPGYLNMPDARKAHESLKDFILTEAVPLSTSYWGNYPKFAVSYFKAQFGDAATEANDYGYAYHPKITGDHSHLPMFVNMAAGQIKGFFVMGQNPAVGGQNARFQRKALARLDWMVVRDFFETETAAFWRNSPEVKSGELKTSEIKTEVFFLPAAAVAEMEGTFTNTQRLVQKHEKAVDPPDDARSDLWFTWHLGLLLKELYRNSSSDRDWAIRNLFWNYQPDARRSREVEDKGRTVGVQGAEGDQRLHMGRQQTAPHLRQPQGGRLDRLRRVDLYRRHPRGGEEQRRAASGRQLDIAQLGLCLAGQPAHHVQPRLRRQQRQSLVGEKEAGLVGPERGQRYQGRAGQHRLR